jgi:hypothetical protein
MVTTHTEPDSPAAEAPDLTSGPSGVRIGRSAGFGLLAYGVGTTFAFMASGSPGGDFSPTDVTAYVSPGHFAAVSGLWYVVMLSALALTFVAQGLHRLDRTGPHLVRLCTIGAAISVAGAFVSGGVAVAMAEGGAAVRNGVPQPVVYTLTEIGNLLAVCGPALCVGVAALVLAWRSPLAGWLRVFSAIAGLCGVLAPAYFTYAVFALWTVVAGAVLAAGRGHRRVSPRLLAG